MVPKRKDERQYAGVSYDVANSTPDDELLDKYNEEGSMNIDSPQKQTLVYYNYKMKCVDLAVDFLKLTQSPLPSDVFKTSAILLDYVVSKNDKTL